MPKTKGAMMCLPRASAGRGFLEPRYSSGARRFMVLVGGWYLRIAEGVRTVQIGHGDILARELKAFHAGNHRLIIAFRHAAKEDAPVMLYAMNKKLGKWIKHPSLSIDAPLDNHKIVPHAWFLYGKDVLEWAGKAAAWLFPKIGCVPVQNRTGNKTGLDLLRREMRDGAFPLALAPEGQVSYHMYHCSDISAGVSSLAAWGEESAKDVTIIPVALGYRHTENPQAFIRSIIKRWSQLTGISIETVEEMPILKLLLETATLTAALLEDIYGIHSDLCAGLDMKQRFHQICNTAMREAERLAKIKPEGNLLDRLFRVRNHGVEAVHPDSFDPGKLPAIGRSMADFHALEAHVYLRHSQVVDILQYIDPDYIAAPCSFGRACEFALNLLDVINRLQGGTIDTRFSPRGKRAHVEIGEPVRLSSIAFPEGIRTRRDRLRHITAVVQSGLEHTSRQLEQLWELGTFEM